MTNVAVSNTVASWDTLKAVLALYEGPEGRVLDAEIHMALERVMGLRNVWGGLSCLSDPAHTSCMHYLESCAGLKAKNSDERIPGLLAMVSEWLDDMLEKQLNKNVSDAAAIAEIKAELLTHVFEAWAFLPASEFCQVGPTPVSQAG